MSLKFWGKAGAPREITLIRSDYGQMADIPSKVVAYEAFLNQTLKEDLKKVLDNRDKIYDQIAEYLQLKNVIQRIQESDLGKEELKTKVDLGCNFYVQARVPDASRIYVCVGYGFFVEFKLPEALKFIEKKTKHLQQEADQLTKDAVKIKAHIKLVLEGLKEIQHFEELPKPQRDIWN
ncbi:hypothetical protein KUTeg_020185 [Tegillarca granosa]|uniref:Protein UXT n=1 Tax=Tegillarca granosa TaxID=220873 RepID=A0ABQ9ED42_TEGGR|nr:hypothetical protein KUTeg_020185 [Tegillarca granosa]